MRISNNQDGMSHILALAGVLLIAVVGFAGYRVMESYPDSNTTSDVANSKAVEPETFKDASDLRKASSALDDQNIESNLNPGQLDEDINGLL